MMRFIYISFWAWIVACGSSFLYATETHDFSVDEGVWDWYDEIFVPEGTHESVIVRCTDSIWDVRGVNYLSVDCAQNAGYPNNVHLQVSDIEVRVNLAPYHALVNIEDENWLPTDPDSWEYPGAALSFNIWENDDELGSGVLSMSFQRVSFDLISTEPLSVGRYLLATNANSSLLDSLLIDDISAFSSDGSVLGDLDIVREGNYFSIYVDVLPVPEPCTSAFFMLGACLVSFRRTKI